MSSKIRTFICVPVPLSVKKTVGGFIKELKARGGDVKWVSPDNMHLTLKFIGDVEKTFIEEIASHTAEAVASFSQFPVEIGGTGAFPNLSRPKVLWVGISRGSDKLRDLAYAVDQSLEKIGIEKDKRQFSGHLTIGRVRSLKGIEHVAESMNKNGFKPQIFNAEAVYVMKSVLDSHGPIHSVLNTINLRG